MATSLAVAYASNYVQYAFVIYTLHNKHLHFVYNVYKQLHKFTNFIASNLTLDGAKGLWMCEKKAACLSYLRTVTRSLTKMLQECLVYELFPMLW